MLISDQKNAVAKDILDVLIRLLEKNKITDSEGREMAKIATVALEKAKSEFDLPEIYKTLSEKWPAFNANAAIEAGKIDILEEKEVAIGVEELIKAGELEKALILARTETEDDK